MSKLKMKNKKASSKNKSLLLNKYHLVGIGRGGCNYLEAILNSGFKAKYTFISTPYRSHLPRSINFIVHPKCDKFFTNGKLSNSVEIDIKDFFGTFDDKSSHFIIISAFGKSTGSYLTYHISKFLSENHYNFDIIASKPFSFEGLSICNGASYTIEKISKYKDMEIVDMNKYRNEKFYSYPFRKIIRLIKQEFVDLVTNRFS